MLRSNKQTNSYSISSLCYMHPVWFLFIYTLHACKILACYLVWVMRIKLYLRG